MKPLRIAAVTATAVALLLLTFDLLPDGSGPSYDLDPLSVQSEKSKRMDSRQGHPDLFFQYQHDIRASENGRNEYPVGYRLKEYQKAVAAAKTSARLPWVERGPGNVGGRTRPIVVDPDDADMKTWWAGSVGGGLWKTVNGGLAWQYQTDHLPVMSISSLAMAESDHDVMYMGTGEGFFNLDGVDGDGIFKSTDRGATWVHLESTTNTADFRHVNRLAVDPTDPNVVVAATSSGIFRTTDGGMTWAHVWSGQPTVQDLRAQPGNFDMQIAGANGLAILFSTDAGETWDNASIFWLDAAGRIELAYSPSEPSRAYAAVDGSTGSQLYMSNDGGMSWQPTVDQAPIPWLGGQGWYDNTLAVHPFNPDTVFVGGIFLWRIIVTDEVTTISGPSEFLRGGSQAWLDWVNFGASRFGGWVSYLDPNAVDVSEADYTTIEIRFGQGTQKAHRFSVSETAGSFGNGGSGIPFSEYRYEDYVEIPFQIWDTDNNRQIMFSFRDQADNGEFDLIEFFTSEDAGTRDQQSREYMIINKYDYDDSDPHDDIAQDGGLVNGLLYFMWPILAPNATWDPANLPNQTLTITYQIADGYLRSIDGEFDPSAITHVDHHNIMPLPFDGSNDQFRVFNANDGGVAWSSDGGATFTEADRAFAGYNTAQFYGVAKKPGLPVYIAGSQDNGTWRSFGNPNNRRGWIPQLGGDGFETVWSAGDPDKVMGSIQFNNIWRSLNGGTSWSNSFSTAAGGLFLTPLSSSDMEPDHVYTVTADGVYYSRDFGGSWILTLIADDWGPWSGGKVRVSQADPDIVWAGFGMDDSPSRRLHLSQDAGVTFDTTALPVVDRAPATIISGLATHPTEASTAYALFSRYGYAKVLETKDMGQTWTDLTQFGQTPSSGVWESQNGFADVAVHDLIVMPDNPNVIWVGTDIGIFKTKSYGKEWNYAHNGLPAVSIWRMKVRDNEIILGTHGRGVWTLPIDQIDVAVEEDELPAGFSLAQNYPNPFNAATTIQFAVPDEAHVRLTIYDAMGRKVSVLTDQAYPAGDHELRWNANALASGVYYYRMESDGKLIQSQSMTLLK